MKVETNATVLKLGWVAILVMVFLIIFYIFNS